MKTDINKSNCLGNFINLLKLKDVFIICIQNVAFISNINHNNISDAIECLIFGKYSNKFEDILILHHSIRFFLYVIFLAII